MRLATGLAAALLSATCFAQTVTSFDLEQFSLNPGARGSLLLETGKTLEAKSLRASLTLQYQHEPLVLFSSGERVGAIVGSRLTTHLAGAYGITDWLEVGLQLPIVVMQSGDDLTTHGVSKVGSTFLGAPIVTGQFALLRQANQAPLDLGLSLGLALPLGSASGLARDPGVGLAFLPRLGAGRSFGSLVRVGLEVGAVVRQAAVLSTFTPTTADEVGSQLTFGGVVSTLGDGLRGELNVRALVPLSRTAVGGEVLGGVRYQFAKLPLELYALGGPGFGQMPGTPLFRLAAGVAWTPDFSPACREGDAYSLADCPQLDRDGDRVANATDRCPEQAGAAALQGCPDQDDDADGVPNLADRCPRVKANSSDGCPPPMEPDRDGDGVSDSADACPADAGLAALRGCPDQDGDGLADAADKCPQEPGTAELQGCKPEPELVKLEAERITINDQVYFGTGTAVLLPQSFALLKQVAALIKEHSELQRVSINGHTDNQGSRPFNLKLSKDRAEAVRAYLVSQGVPNERLETHGFGPDQPIAPNSDAAGREKNRRVEFAVH